MHCGLEYELYLNCVNKWNLTYSTGEHELNTNGPNAAISMLDIWIR